MAEQIAQVLKYYKGFDAVQMVYPSQDSPTPFFEISPNSIQRFKFPDLEKFNRFAVQIEIIGNNKSGPIITRVGRSIGPLSADSDVAFYTDADVVDGNATPELTSDGTVYYDLQIRKLQNLFVEIENQSDGFPEGRIFLIADR